MKSNKLMAAAIVLSFSSMITTTTYAGSVVLRNCTANTVEVQTYNNNDEAQTNPKDNKSISNEGEAKLICGTTECRVVINNNYKGTGGGYHLICPEGGSISNRVSSDMKYCRFVDIVC